MSASKPGCLVERSRGARPRVLIRRHPSALPWCGHCCRCCRGDVLGLNDGRSANHLAGFSFRCTGAIPRPDRSGMTRPCTAALIQYAENSGVITTLITVPRA